MPSRALMRPQGINSDRRDYFRLPTINKGRVYYPGLY